MAVTSEAIRLVADREESDVIASISVARGNHAAGCDLQVGIIIVYYHYLTASPFCVAAQPSGGPDPCLDRILSDWEERPGKAHPPKKRLSLSLRAAASQGADTLLLCGSDIDLPMSRAQHRIPRPIGSRRNCAGQMALSLGHPGTTAVCQVWLRTRSITPKTCETISAPIWRTDPSVA